MNLSSIDTSRPGGWGLLIRHAERHSIAGRGIGLDVRLTDDGRRAAHALGRELADQRLGVVCASPVLRCWETGVEVLCGHGLAEADAKQTVITEPQLASAYVVDVEIAQRSLLSGRLEEVVVAHAGGESIPGMRDVAEGSERLLTALLPHLAPATVSLFVTHDALVLPFRCHYAGRRPALSDWVGYLDGAVVYADAETLTVDGVPVPRPVMTVPGP